jgi:hypothetical protein
MTIIWNPNLPYIVYLLATTPSQSSLYCPSVTKID